MYTSPYCYFLNYASSVFCSDQPKFETLILDQGQFLPPSYSPCVQETRADSWALHGGHVVCGHPAGGREPRHQDPGQPPDDLI